MELEVCVCHSPAERLMTDIRECSLDHSSVALILPAEVCSCVLGVCISGLQNDVCPSFHLAEARCSGGSCQHPFKLPSRVENRGTASEAGPSPVRRSRAGPAVENVSLHP